MTEHDKLVKALLAERYRPTPPRPPDATAPRAAVDPPTGAQPPRGSSDSPRNTQPAAPKTPAST